jgi:AraC-like DNA-binding protein
MVGTMRYEKILPPVALRDYVRFFWVLDNDADSDGLKTFRTIADGSPGLIFQHCPQGSLFQFGKKLAPVFLYGQSTCSTDISAPANLKTIGIYFYPHALRSIFNLNASELTNTCIDITCLEGGVKQLTDDLLNASSTCKCIEILSCFLQNQICSERLARHSAVLGAVARIKKSGGSISMPEIRTMTGFSERDIERKFRDIVGLSPLQYSRICRFQSSLDQLRTNRFEKLSDLAFNNDYADQSHFIRDFKQFSGLLPNYFQRSTKELIENFPEIIL